MEQIQFSEFVKSYLTQYYPQFINSVKYQPDGSFDCSIENKTKAFSLWIATYNIEITVGLEDPAKTSGCHTHFTPYDERDLPEVLHELGELLEEIFSNKRMFYYSNIHGYSWTNDAVETVVDKKPSESVQFFTWNGSL